METFLVVLALLAVAFSTQATASANQIVRESGLVIPAVVAVTAAGMQATGASPGQQHPGTVKTLPLRLGWYAHSKADCTRQYSDGLELKATGFEDIMENFAKYKKIARLSPTEYLVTEEWTAEDGSSTEDNTFHWKVLSDTSFTKGKAATDPHPQVFTWCHAD